MKWLTIFFTCFAMMAGAGQIEGPDWAERLPDADVVFLGEVHDNPHHHANQRQALETLLPKAVVFEMITSDLADGLPPSLLTDRDALETYLDWVHGGWPDFDMYFPLFAASQHARIYGALVPRAALRGVVSGTPVPEVFGDGAALYGLDQPLAEDEQADREAEQFAAHCDALPENLLPGMVAAQRLRDAKLAQQIDRAMADTGGPVVVLTGNGHARRDWGAPRLITTTENILVVGQFESLPNDADGLFDMFHVTEAAEREDPCAAFR